jgi:hypothetical protein
VRRLIRRLSGSLLNAIGLPGFIQASSCRERPLGVAVEVRVGPLFTVVAVQNVRLLFHRLSGRFDGVIVEPSDCSETAIRGKHAS